MLMAPSGQMTKKVSDHLCQTIYLGSYILHVLPLAIMQKALTVTLPSQQV